MLRASVLLSLSLLACKGEEVESSQADASTETSDAGSPELLKNPGFELGCAGWNTYNATAEESTTAHGGSRSCRVCGLAGEYDFGLWQPMTAPAIGKTYVGEAWVRTAPDDAGAAVTPHLSISTHTSDTAPVVEEDLGPNVPLDSTWRRASSLLTITKSSVEMRFSLRALTGGTCFLVDDASLRIAP